MNRKKNIVIFFLVVIAMFLNYKISYACKTEDLLEGIIKTTKSSVIECGIKTRFSSMRKGQELVKYFVSRLSSTKNTEIKHYKHGENYFIEFENKISHGHIQIINSKGESTVIINIIKKSKRNELNQLKNEIENNTAEISKDRKIYYQYIKGKLPNGNLSKINDKLICLLKNKNSKNISSIKINNGFSTCAYTQRYEKKINNGRLMDLNYALSSYSSGDYIIVGTPEIITTY